MNINIQKASIEQLLTLQQISKQTFSETFAAQNTEENMASYLADGFSLEKLQDELINSNSEFYFALKGQTVIGYLKVNVGTAQTELQDHESLEIERLYVLKDFHGQQVGQLLFDKAIALAKQKKLLYVWLGVWEENPRAIRFYEKNGFEAFGSHVFTMGNEEQRDILMKLRI